MKQRCNSGEAIAISPRLQGCLTRLGGEVMIIQNIFNDILGKTVLKVLELSGAGVVNV